MVTHHHGSIGAVGVTNKGINRGSPAGPREFRACNDRRLVHQSFQGVHLGVLGPGINPGDVARQQGKHILTSFLRPLCALLRSRGGRDSGQTASLH